MIQQFSMMLAIWSLFSLHRYLVSVTRLIIGKKFTTLKIYSHLTGPLLIFYWSYNKISCKLKCISCKKYVGFHEIHVCDIKEFNTVDGQLKVKDDNILLIDVFKETQLQWLLMQIIKERENGWSHSVFLEKMVIMIWGRKHEGYITHFCWKGYIQQ